MQHRLKIRVRACALIASMFSVATAAADDAYICDGGRLVYARPETLEKLKQTDPCIAGHFGAAPGVVAAAAAVATPAPAKPMVAPPSAPTVRPTAPRLEAPAAARRDATRPAAPVKPLALKPAPAPNALPPLAPKAEAPRSPPPPGQAADFRNVRIINALPGEEAVYRHAR